MPDDIDWSQIPSGDVFQSFANTLICHIDPLARPFTRPGPDGAQDCASFDRKTIYQAKFHRDQRSSYAFSDALHELGNIDRYRSDEHRNREIWRGAKHWILVTNVPFNASDDLRWETEVVPAFRKAGLTATYWGDGKIRSKLADYPEVRHAYFEGETRLFLALPEVRTLLLDQELVGTRDAFPSGDIVGRDLDLQVVEAQLADSDTYALLLHGPGGVGKTRFLYELASRAVENETFLDVRWANVANLEASTSWYAGLIPERKSLIILDDPESPTLVKRVLEELWSNSRVRQSWKVVVALRTANDAIVQVFDKPTLRKHIKKHELRPLSQDESRNITSTLFKNLGIHESEATQRRLAELADGYPVWLTVGADILSRSNGTAASVDQWSNIARRYVEEALASQGATSSAPTTEKVLRWLALTQPLNVEDEHALSFAATSAGMTAPAFHRELVTLSRRRAVHRVGVNQRVFSIKPDVIRDSILLNWLTFDDGVEEGSSRRLTDAGTALAHRIALLLSHTEQTGSGIPLTRFITRLGSIERILGGQVDLLSHAMKRLIEIARTELGASTRIHMISRASSLAPFQPAHFVHLCEVLRTVVSHDERDSRPGANRLWTHDDVVLSLAWPLFSAGQTSADPSSQERVLNELFAIAVEEARIAQKRMPHNDGKRAGELLSRLITNEPEVLRNYGPIAHAVGLKVVGQLDSTNSVDAAYEAASRALVDAQLTLRRVFTYFEENKIHMAEVLLDSEHDETDRRRQLLARILQLLAASGQATHHRVIAWKMLAVAQREANQAASRLPGAAAEAHSTLAFVHQQFATRKLPLAEIQAASETWNWNMLFDKDALRKELALKCEALLLEHPDVRGVSMLLSSYSESQTARAEAVEKLLTSDEYEIESFFRRCISFVRAGGKPHRLGIVQHIAFELGNQAGNARASVDKFAFAISTENDTDLLSLRIAVFAGLVHSHRSCNDAAEFVRALTSTLGDATLRRRILGDVYAGVGPFITPSLLAAELSVIDDLTSDDDVAAAPWLFRVVGRFVGSDKGHVWKLVHKWWRSAPQSQRQDYLTELITGFHERLLYPAQTDAFDAKDFSNVLKLLGELSDVDAIGGNAMWTLNDLRKTQARLSPVTLIDLLEERSRVRNSQTSDDASSARHFTVPDDATFYSWFRSVTETPEDEALIARVLDWSSGEDELAYHAPEILSRIDADGIVAAREVVRRIREIPTDTPPTRIWQLTRFVGAFREVRPGWRTMAKEACALASRLAVDKRASVYSSLRWRGTQMFSGVVGELHPRWEEAVLEARRKRDEEVDPHLREYFEWTLQLAETELVRQRQILDEEDEL